jgi:hypothetical protein
MFGPIGKPSQNSSVSASEFQNITGAFLGRDTIFDKTSSNLSSVTHSRRKVSVRGLIVLKKIAVWNGELFWIEFRIAG